MLRFEGIFVFLHQAPAAAQPLPEVIKEARKGTGRFAIIVDDVDSVCGDRRARRANAHRARRPDWGMRTATFADPGGHIWEIAQEIPSADG